MRKTNLIIRVREFGYDTDPFFAIESIVADSEKAHTVAEKYNDIAEATKEKNTSYHVVGMTLPSSKNKDNVTVEVPF